MKKIPPKIANLILRLILSKEEYLEKSGDLEEVYFSIREETNKVNAAFWYWYQVIKAIPGLISSSFFWGAVMFKNSIKIALRNIKKHKAFAAINIFGLAVGITAAMFILFWVNDELSYDKFHDKSERIYRVTQYFTNSGRETNQTQTPGILAPTLQSESSEVELVTRVRGFRNGTIVTVGDKKIHETQHGMADDQFFNVFSFPLIKGNPETVLSLPFTAVISESAANKYFGNEDPIGKVMTIYEDDFQITGVYEDMPANSHFHLDILYSVASVSRYSEPNWGVNVFKTYVLLREGGNVEKLRSDLANIVKNNVFKSVEDYENFLSKDNKIEFPVMPLTDIHLNSNVLWEFEANGNATYVRYFITIAFFILFIAVVNYINLSTARSSGRAKEVGVRKTVGSTRTTLLKQFLTESILTSLISLVIALLLSQLLMPYFKHMVGKPWLTNIFFNDPSYILGLILLTICIGFLAGIYPAIILSSFKPIAVLRGKFSGGIKNSKLRNGLVVFQFTMSIILLIGTFVVKKQMNFVQTQNLGFDREQVIVVKTFGQIGNKVSTFKETLLSKPSIIAASVSTSIPGKAFDNIGTHLHGTNSWRATNIFAVDEDFFKVMEMEMSEGRFFSKETPTDDLAVIVNQSLVHDLAAGNLMNKQFDIWVGREKGELPFHVIGIVKDFHYESFHEPVKPVKMILTSGQAEWGDSYLSVRVRPENISESLDHINATWNEMIPGSPFEFSFLDSVYDRLYMNEKLTENIFTIFSLFALFVACLGLLGLSAFAAEQKMKEIGIRKVLGASISNIVLNLVKQFSIWVVAANIIAWPLAYYLMNRWLQDFAYRTEIEIGVFVLAGVYVLIIALVTVSFQSIKAAVSNPLDSIRTE